MGETTCYIRVCYCESSTGHACHCVDKFFHADGDCRSVRVDDGTKNASPEPAANEVLVARLRGYVQRDSLEAADVIERQAKELERLRAQLKSVNKGD